MLSIADILESASHSQARVGIAGGEKAAASAKKAEQKSYGSVCVYRDPREMAEDLSNGSIEAAVRGDAPANDAMRAVRDTFNLSKVLRAVLIQPPEGRLFLLGPAGIDEGWTVQEKLQFAGLGAQLCRCLGVEPVIGIMSGGRSADIGRMSEIDISIRNAEEAVRLAKAEGLDARNMQILIEEAAKQCDIIIAPDGISGNLIFRTLHFLGKGTALGAPILNIEKIYVDTSRAKEDYTDSIALAAALTNDNFNMRFHGHVMHAHRD